MSSENLDNVPAESIHVDPPALDPRFSLPFEELLEGIIVEFILPHFMLRKVHHRDFTLSLQVTGHIGCPPRAVERKGFRGVDTGFRPRLPVRGIVYEALGVV